MKDRAHQAELRTRLGGVDSGDFPLKILAWVVPGGGKSRLPGILAERFPNHKIGWFVPRLSLQTQAVKDMAEHFGMELRDSGNDVNPSRGSRGFVATHGALENNPDLWRDELERQRYVVIFDESQHAKIERNGNYRPLALAASRLKADVWLSMSGTLQTSDGTMIWGMKYDDVPNGILINPERSADVYIRYERQTGLLEGQICPMEFHHHDGPIKWKRGEGDEKEARISKVDREDEGAAIFTALRTEVAIQLFESGLNHWRQHSQGKLLVVTDFQHNAKKYANKLRCAGLSVALGIDDNPEARTEIERFRLDPSVQALTTCQMAYEGLNVPAIDHVVCLTHIRSTPWIEQMLARAWRGGKPQCWAFVPDDPRMNRVIKKIREEQLAVLKDGGGDGGDGPGRQSILALHGLVDEVEKQFLDGGFATSGPEQEIIQLVRKLGLTGSEPEVLNLLNRIRRAAVPAANGLTLSEREMNLRRQISDEARDIDRILGERAGKAPEWGSTQKRLIRITNKSITEMNEEELKRAHTALQSLRP